MVDVGRFFAAFGEITSGVFGGLTDRGRGLHGYSHSFMFDRGRVMLAYGGQRNTAFLSLPGEGCAYVRDWPRLVRHLRDTLAARITRWDGAVDDLEGRHSVDLAVELYKTGGFTNNGRPPRHSCIGDWLDPSGHGRTLAIGKRENGKLLRVYEKGKQLGDPNSPWVRWEVELHNIDRYIPWDVVLRPGDFVAASYPCMSWVRGHATRIPTLKAHDTISYDRLTDAAALAYGPLINCMLEREGSAERVMQMLRRPGAPRRLQFPQDCLEWHGADDAL